jgi:hypothetical protein
MCKDINFPADPLGKWSILFLLNYNNKSITTRKPDLKMKIITSNKHRQPRTQKQTKTSREPRSHIFQGVQKLEN